MAVLSKDIRRVLSEGGFVRFIWSNCRAELVTPRGVGLRIDGRTYQGFLKTLAPFERTETGSTEGKDLVIEWRKDQGMSSEPIDYGKYPVRTCRSLHHCEICGKDITHGNSYHDGGPGKRAHVLCEKERRFNEYNANPRPEEA